MLIELHSLQEEQPSWVVKMEEVKITDEELGRGAWGAVNVAQFRGLRVAAKRIHKTIISDYNRKQFTREMNIIAKLRHPNLLLFVGATREGELVILTELMPTSLRKELEKGKLTTENIVSISRDIACGMSYLHQWKPHPLIHRDISSANILLEPLPKSWRAKLSDYGSANFVNLISLTSNPGNPTYAAPEAAYPDQHSPKMDVFSFGVMLVEMCLGEFPETRPEQRESQIQCIGWSPMENLIRRCISESPANRPCMNDVMHELDLL